MTDDEYKLHMGMLKDAIRLLSMVPVRELRDMVSKADVLGPILEPTAYVRGGADNLRDQREILDAALHLMEVVDKVTIRAVSRT